MDRERAAEFFGQLEDFTVEYLGKLGHLHWKPRKTGQLEKPYGAVIHYTRRHAGQETARYFAQGDVFSHVLVFPEMTELGARLYADYPLLDELPVTVLQFARPTRRAVHATWANAWSYGIENVNAGLLEANANGYAYGKHKIDLPASAKVVRSASGQAWHAYTEEQVLANVVVLRQVQQFRGEFFAPERVLGHEHVQSVATRGGSKRDKRDPGPLYPLQAVRELVCESPSLDPKRAGFWNNIWPDPYADRTRNDGYVLELFDHLGLEPRRPGDPPEAWDEFRELLDIWKKVGLSAETVLPVQRTALRVLGYDPGDDLAAGVESADKVTARIFCRMLGRTWDGAGYLPGDAVVARMIDRGVFPIV